MNLTVFQAGKGDCLLLAADDGKRILVDGGMRSDYKQHVAPALAQLAAQDADLDLVCVSHIDRDHISGVLQLMDDLVAWRVYDYQQERGNERFRQPERPRPPEIRDLWHNGFGELLKADARAIEDTLAMKAGLLEASAGLEATAAAAAHRELATSVAEGIELSRRTAQDQLGIPLNRQFGGKLALVRDGARAVRIGTLKLTVIGPFPVDLRKLRAEWKNWLRENRQQHERLRRRMQRDSDRLATDFERLRDALDSETELGHRENVTVPNLASLMLLVQEGDRTVLLTGDGHHADILDGLEHAKRLDADGSIHVDVLKIQHHGSEHNLDAAFAKRVTADHYLFLANGEHENPDLRVVRTVIDSRLGPSGVRSTHPRADKPFQFHFNSSPQTTEGSGRAHMRSIERLATKAAKASNGRMTCNFLTGSSFSVALV
jgi:hypothetical protein